MARDAGGMVSDIGSEMTGAGGGVAAGGVGMICWWGCCQRAWLAPSQAASVPQ